MIAISGNADWSPAYRTFQRALGPLDLEHRLRATPALLPNWLSRWLWAMVGEL